MKRLDEGELHALDSCACSFIDYLISHTLEPTEQEHAIQVRSFWYYTAKVLIYSGILSQHANFAETHSCSDNDVVRWNYIRGAFLYSFFGNPEFS